MRQLASLAALTLAGSAYGYLYFPTLQRRMIEATVFDGGGNVVHDEVVTTGRERFTDQVAVQGGGDFANALQDTTLTRSTFSGTMRTNVSDNSSASAFSGGLIEFRLTEPGSYILDANSVAAGGFFFSLTRDGDVVDFFTLKSSNVHIERDLPAGNYAASINAQSTGDHLGWWSAGGTFTFKVIPAPASAALLLGGMLFLPRRRGCIDLVVRPHCGTMGEGECDR